MSEMNEEKIERGTEETPFQNRLKSWPLWLAVGALVVFAVKQFGGLDISQEMNDFLNVLCPVLVGFGIINNPTDKKHV